MQIDVGGGLKKYADVENKFINAVRLEKLVNAKTGYIGNYEKSWRHTSKKVKRKFICVKYKKSAHVKS